MMGTSLIWWLMMLVLGMGFMPLSAILFKNYRDCGWMFSKVLGAVLPGYFVWLLVSTGLFEFTTTFCVVIVLMGIVLNIGIFWCRLRKGKSVFWITRENGKLIICEELLFLALFLFWTYLAGFHPEAKGTEKFMDYGFMASMMRSTKIPAPDIWYAGEGLNYYYGGQYFAVFLTKISFTRIQETYNVMRTLVAAFAFMMPFAIARQLWEDRAVKADGKKRTGASVPAGLLAGAAVSFAGNMHYVLAGPLLRFFRGFLGHDSDYTYWFSNSTRYIGYYPKGSDRTIHEYPAYSFVLGDLHAHVVNLMFVLCLVGIIYAFMKAPIRVSKIKQKAALPCRLIRSLKNPYYLMFGVFLGIFHFTNYWDFPIYFVVIMAVVVYRNLREGQFAPGYAIGRSLLHGAWMLIISELVALPFTLQFKSMVSGIALAENHTSFKQLLVVWGFPLILCTVFVVWTVIKNAGKTKNRGRFRSLMENTHPSDLFVAGLVLCAIGLVLIPELVYVRDIYEENSARANTMFKLTYQAFTLLGISMAYILMRFLLNKSRALYVTGILGSICLFSTIGYLGTAVSDWFGDVLDRSGFQGLDATAYLEEEYPTDAGAIDWLNEHVDGSPVIVEACGDSYSEYQRVSAMTGLPCVLGWYVHEWLWRNDTDDLNQRKDDVKLIYTSDDEAEVHGLLEKYDVSYIYVGDLEREKYGEINDSLLKSAGEVVFERNDTYIIAISG
ncbi:DUF2298 domain-containing protein [Ruminococcus gauvreauii]|uniref:DUF2298 domain-containing protein n=1 Tax=Ruminococcus gauvreauii TaxID=438033 RepID=A0ABY5VHM0_9FIRM|nr:DUF2298 domain-containing protein [Ruminococcus gauvreauii]UWP60059.1 DUF2298 domain-containing protein [Ruminococcus gauvreauii]